LKIQSSNGDEILSPTTITLTRTTGTVNGKTNVNHYVTTIRISGIAIHVVPVTEDQGEPMRKPIQNLQSVPLTKKVMSIDYTYNFNREFVSPDTTITAKANLNCENMIVNYLVNARTNATIVLTKISTCTLLDLRDAISYLTAALQGYDNSTISECGDDLLYRNYVSMAKPLITDAKDKLVSIQSTALEVKSVLSFAKDQVLVSVSMSMVSDTLEKTINAADSLCNNLLAEETRLTDMLNEMANWILVKPPMADFLSYYDAFIGCSVITSSKNAILDVVFTVSALVDTISALLDRLVYL